MLDKPLTTTSQRLKTALTSRAAKMIVVSWERSPHSAKKVNVNACKNTLDMKNIAFFFTP